MMPTPHDIHETIKEASPSAPSCILITAHRTDETTSNGHILVQHIKELAIQPLPCISRYERHPPARQAISQTKNSSNAAGCEILKAGGITNTAKMPIKTGIRAITAHHVKNILSASFIYQYIIYSSYCNHAIHIENQERALLMPTLDSCSR